MEQTTACKHPVVPVEDGQHVIGIFVPAKHNAVALWQRTVIVPQTARWWTTNWCWLSFHLLSNHFVVPELPALLLTRMIDDILILRWINNNFSTKCIIWIVAWASHVYVLCQKISVICIYLFISLFISSYIEWHPIRTPILPLYCFSFNSAFLSLNLRFFP